MADALTLLTGFAPVVGKQPRLLILGSMPSAASLAAGQYYGLPRNAFWTIMGELFGAGRELAYDQRLDILRDQGIALWDVLQACEREGSLDSAIKMRNARTNDFARFFKRHRSIRPFTAAGCYPKCNCRRPTLPMNDCPPPARPWPA
jgi:hypoxanthine-DNA glycosylase